MALHNEILKKSEADKNELIRILNEKIACVDNQRNRVYIFLIILFNSESYTSKKNWRSKQ